MGVVVFNATTFKARYPEFSTIADLTLQAYFDESTLFLSNANASPVRDLKRRAYLLNMLTAHIAALNSGVNGVPASPLAGRINQATEGSVTVSADVGPVTNSQAWYLQTKYGAEYWQATAIFRTFRYRPGMSRPAGMLPWR